MTRFQKGDIVSPTTYYASVGLAETRAVLKVIERDGREYIQLRNPGSPYGTSDYAAYNFELVSRAMQPTPKTRDREMALERTKYFAVKIDGSMAAHDSAHGIVFEDIAVGGTHTTGLRDNRHQVQMDVAKKIAEGDKWLVLQTVALIEGEEPRPPIKVTEYAR